jgi:2-iminobutanoate/2-iminopropanoate deaminase
VKRSAPPKPRRKGPAPPKPGRRRAISSPDAPKAIGPYSSALRAGNLLFVSGQVPFDPQSGEMVAGDIGVQTRRVLDNVAALLSAAGLSFAHVARTTVFLADMNDFAAMNDVYRAYFAAPYPARSTVQAARLPRDARIEIDAIAVYEVG